MTIQYLLDPEPTPELEEGILRLWAEVTNAGGAVGFVPTVTPEDVRPVYRRHLRGVVGGSSRILVGVADSAAAGTGAAAVGEVRALAFLELNDHPLMRHWLWLYRVMVHPGQQGGGEGRRLMATAERAARSVDGIQSIRLTCRGGLGLERFYASCGYKEVGRVPEGIKVAEDDYRDDVTMWLPLL